MSFFDPTTVYGLAARFLTFDEYDLLLQDGFVDVAGLPEATHVADGQWAAGAYVLADGRTVLVGYIGDAAIVVGP